MRGKDTGEKDVDLMPLGGAGTGQHQSFAQYVAHQLSMRIGDGRLPQVEGSFLYRAHLHTQQYKDGNSDIVKSSTGQRYDLSMFRLRD